MTAIFISHSSRDAAAAAEVSAWLVSQGHRSFFLDFDPEYGIPAGRNWEQELYQRLRACRAVIVLCSRASMESKWCFAEVTQARSLGKAMVPIRIDECKVDGVLSSQQVIDLGDDREEAFERLRRGLLTAGLDPADMFDWDLSRAPYPGLLAFQEQDAAVYFGREKEIGDGLDLLNRVRRLGSPRVVVVVGASGSGKSSLVRAGLVPRLRRDPERWLVLDSFRPRDDPVAELAAIWDHAFAAVGEARDRGELLATLRASIEDSTSTNPVRTMSGELRRAARRSDATALIVVDQFEELLDPTSPDAAGVLRWLRTATDAADGSMIMLATLRSDFLGTFQKHPELVDVGCELMPVGPMSIEDVAHVIEGPAGVAGLELGPGLVQAMLNDSGGDDGLPLLAFTLREMYDHFGGDGRLDAEEYRELGGLAGALAQVADDVVESQRLTAEQEDELRRAFLAMARLTDDDRWVRQVVRWDQLPSSLHPVLERFVTARLLVSSGDPEARTLDIAHEALFRSWHRLAGWLQKDAEAFRLRRELENASATWLSDGRQPADLWRGARLDRADEMAQAGDLNLSTIEQEFIDAAMRARDAEFAELERARRRKLRVAAGVTAGALVLAGIAIVFFIQARRQSDRATEQADRNAALALATQANDVSSQNPALALALAAEAVRTTSRPSPQAVVALVRARITLAGTRGQPVGQPLEGHIGLVYGLAFSPDSELLASAGLDGTVRLWDPATGQLVGQPLEGHDGGVSGIAFSPDGTLVASAGVDGTVRLWDPASGQQVGQPLQSHAGGVTAVAFSPDGALLASAGDDGTVRLWDPATGQQVGQTPQIDAGPMWQVEFSPDGALLATAGDDGAVRLWDPSTGQAVGEPLLGHDGRVAGVAFSRDGQLLASTGVDEGMVRLWDPATGQPIGEPLRGHIGRVTGVAFSSDGQLLVSAGDDGARLWDPATGQPIGEPLRGHTGEVSVVAFSPGGTLLASAGDDGAVRLWDPTVGQPVGQPLTENGLALTGVAFSPDGALLASAGSDGTLRLWDAATEQPVGEPIEIDTWALPGVTFSPDGALLASVRADNGTLQWWDPTTGEPVGEPIQTDRSGVVGLRVSPDGALLASAGGVGTVRLWDATTGEPIGRPLERNEMGVSAVAFSPDGSLLASAGGDGAVRLWDPTTGQSVGRPLPGNNGGVLGVTFSANGELVAAAGFDGSVRLWDAASGEPLGQPLQGHDEAVLAVAFSPDGALLASAGVDGTVRLWDPANGQPVGEPLEGHAGAVIGLSFSPDGAKLASAGVDGTLRLWDPADVDHACSLAERYVTLPQLREYLAPGREPQACQLLADAKS